MQESRDSEHCLAPYDNGGSDCSEPPPVILSITRPSVRTRTVQCGLSHQVIKNIYRRVAI